MSSTSREPRDFLASPSAEPTVFIVDDDQAVRDSLSLLLKSVGLISEAYESAEAFLEAYNTARRGCLVLDVRMPGMNGLELQAELAARQIRIPIILLTGHADVPMAIRAFKAGAMDLIEKPFENQVFLSRIRKALAEETKKSKAGEINRRSNPARYWEKELAHLTLASISDGVITTNARGIVEYLNPIAEYLTGWKSANARGKPLQEVFCLIDEVTRRPLQNLWEPFISLGKGGVRSTESPEEEEIQTILMQRDGREFPVDTSVAPIRDHTDATLGYVIIFHDVTRARTAARQLSYYATHDPLTGLVNRREFERRLERALASAWEKNIQHTLCYLDLDRFKIVNDAAGHAAGDQLLRQISVLLRKKLRQRDTLARIGGDEFAILLEHCSTEDAQTVADNLCRSIQEFRFTWNDRVFSVGASIGLTAVSADSTSINTLLQAADAACLSAKAQGRNRIQTYDEDSSHELEKYHYIGWFNQLDKALRENRLQLYHQKIAPLRGHNLGIYYEILVRMENPSGQMLAAAAFMPAAERNNLALSVDRWVIRRVLQWLAKYPQRLTQLYLCSVNLSRQILSDEQFPEFLDEQLAETGIPPTKLCFEFMETAVTTDLPEATCLLEALKAAGCRVAIDDFASTPAGFSYLKHLPVDFLKIDGYLVRDIVDNPISHAMVKSIAEIATVMEISTVAKFVENRAILDSLDGLGIDYIQGFCVGEPTQLVEQESLENSFPASGAATVDNQKEPPNG